MDKIELKTARQMEAELARCVANRRLPDCFLYTGCSGAKNWLSLDSSKDFPIAADLTKLLKESLPDLQKHINTDHNLVSIGVGSGEKERLILEEMTKKGRPRYWCVDVSSSLVDVAMEAVADMPVDTTGVVAYLEDIDELAGLWQQPIMLSLLGNNFCNYEPDSLLPTVREELAGEDIFLFDCHLLDQPEKVNHAYRSDLNKQFNIQPLVARGLLPESLEFHIELTSHKTSVGTARRTRKWLEIKEDTELTVAGDKIRFKAGEEIEMGFTYKFETGQVEKLLERYGFKILERKQSSARNNMLVLAAGTRR